MPWAGAARTETRRLVMALAPSAALASEAKINAPVPKLQPKASQVHQSVAPYLTAALSVLQTLERELRSAAAPGSREELSADALALRATELQTQITLLDLEARSSLLEEQLNTAFGP